VPEFHPALDRRPRLRCFVCCAAPGSVQGHPVAFDSGSAGAGSAVMSRAGSQELGEQEGGSVQVRAIKPLRGCPPASWRGQWRHFSIASLPCSFPALIQLLLPCHTPRMWGRMDSACRGIQSVLRPSTHCNGEARYITYLKLLQRTQDWKNTSELCVQMKSALTCGSA